MTRTFFAVVIAGTALTGQTFDRTKEPATQPLPPFKLPPVYETKLSNGLGVVLVEDARFPLVSIRLTFAAGSKFDPPDSPGLAENTAALLTEGTGKRTSRQLAEELASIGGTLNGRSTADSLVLAGGSLAAHTATLIELAADVARNADFPKAEVDLRKQNRLQALLQQQSDPAFLAEERFAAVLYGAHPYSRIAPTAGAIEKLDASAVKAFRDARIVPNNAVLILLGRIPARAEALKLIDTHFGSWQRKDLKDPAAPAPPEPSRRVVLVNRPGSVQADIRAGQVAVNRQSAEYLPLVTGTTILGGGASSRLFNNIREKKGYAYSVHSYVDARRESSAFTAVTQVRNEVVEPAMTDLLGELEAMAKERVTAGELTSVKNYLSGRFVMGLETHNGLIEQLNLVKSMALPDDYIETYTTRLRSVEPDQILRAASKYVLPAKAAIVVVGDAEKIGKSLEKFGKVEVVKSN